jgi:c-di-GMP-binding flagellar brake protein YcgR
LGIKPLQPCRVVWGAFAINSFLQDVVGGELLVSCNLREAPAAGTRVAVLVVQMHSMLEFMGTVTRFTGPRIQGFWVECEEGCTRVQRRQYVRHETSVPVVYTVYSGDGEEGFGPDHETRTFDISGGGVSLHVPGELPNGSVLGVEIRLPGGGSVFAAGRVVRAWPGPGESGGWLVGVAFTSIEERDRDRLVSFIFEDQLRLRRRGLL